MRSTLSTFTKHTMGRVRRRTSTKQRSITLVVHSFRHRCRGKAKNDSSSGKSRSRRRTGNWAPTYELHSGLSSAEPRSAPSLETRGFLLRNLPSRTQNTPQPLSDRPLARTRANVYYPYFPRTLCRSQCSLRTPVLPQWRLDSFVACSALSSLLCIGGCVGRATSRGQSCRSQVSLVPK